MTEDIFLSYKREDKERAEIFVEAFKKTELTLWWDNMLDTGDIYRGIIQKKLEETGCVVVLWSENSVKRSGSIEPSFVWDEANKGKQLNKLVPVLIEDVNPPLGFGEIQTLNLVGLERGYLPAGICFISEICQENFEIEPLERDRQSFSE